MRVSSVVTYEAGMQVSKVQLLYMNRSKAAVASRYKDKGPPSHL